MFYHNAKAKLLRIKEKYLPTFVFIFHYRYYNSPLIQACTNNYSMEAKSEVFLWLYITSKGFWSSKDKIVILISLVIFGFRIIKLSSRVLLSDTVYIFY